VAARQYVSLTLAVETQKHFYTRNVIETPVKNMPVQLTMHGGNAYFRAARLGAAPLMRSVLARLVLVRATKQGSPTYPLSIVQFGIVSQWVF